MIRFDLFRTMSLFAVGMVSLGAATIIIDGSQTRQTIEGFGTCLVSWNKQADVYDEAMAEIYAKTLGFNFLRVNMAAWGYPQTEDAEQITADKIDLTAKDNRRLPVFIEFAKKVKVHQPDLKVIGTVWSPVAWMKLNNQITSGKGDKKEWSINGNSYEQKGKKTDSRNRVDPKYFQHFCRWIVAQMQVFDQAGVPFAAISPGNEVMFNQDFESCVWTAKDFATIIAMLGDTIAELKVPPVRLFGPETMTQHNWSIANPLYIEELQKNAKAWKYLDIFATHGYVDGFKEDTRAESSQEFWNLIKDSGKTYWMTEGGTGEHKWPAPLTGVGAAVHNSLVGGNASAFVPWQVSGNKPSTHDLMVGHDLDKKTQVIRHYSAAILPGSKRISLDDGGSPVRMSAYWHADKQRLVIVLINPQVEPTDLSFTLAGLDAKQFQVVRTSAEEDYAKQPALVVDGKTIQVAVMGQCVMTLVAEEVQAK